MSQNPAVRLLIQSGVVPKNVIQQLVSWKFLPEGSENQAGEAPVSLESRWDNVEDFVNDLKAVLIQEMRTIRETCWDPSTVVLVDLYSPDSRIAGVEGRIDTLHRLYVPPEAIEKLGSMPTSVLLNGAVSRRVLSDDVRYDGDGVRWILLLLQDTDSLNS